MESIREIFRIGRGPSSSHTMGPFIAARLYKNRHPYAKSFKVALYGSLALTGKGHLTDIAIKNELAPAEVDIIWKKDEIKSFHPNALEFEVADDKAEPDRWLVYSVGGGKIVEDVSKYSKPKRIYKINNMKDMLALCAKENKNFCEIVFDTESKGIEQYLLDAWNVMKKAIQRGITRKGTLPGGLNLKRRAKSYYEKSKNLEGRMQIESKLFAYALAVAEENASGGEVATAPTCGSAGVLPAVLKIVQEYYKLSDNEIIHALATAGLIGNVVRYNASISGAEVGCQGEIGTACAMAAASAAQLAGGSRSQIEYAAEMGLEHHLGLTCDPVKGLVQIPCIERNAHAAARAFDCALYSLLSDGDHFVSFDTVVRAMKQTGRDLPKIYKETALGGLAVFADQDTIEG